MKTSEANIPYFNNAVSPGADISRSPSRLLNMNFLLLWQGQTVSRIGTQVFAIAMIFWIKHTTNSASLIGFMLMCSAIPEVLLATLGGMAADRYSRRLIIILCDFLSGISMLLLALVFFVFPGAPDFIIAAIFGVSIIIAIINSFFEPSIAAALPDIVPKNKLAGANSLGQLSQQISLFLGQGLGGLLYRLLGAPLLVLFNGFSFIFSGISEIFIRIPQKLPGETNESGKNISAFIKELTGGFNFIWKNKGLKNLVLLSAFINFFTMPIIVLLPFYIEDFLLLKEDWYGYILALYGAGTLAGYFSASLLKITGRSKSFLIIILMMLEAAGYASLSFIHHPFFSLVLAFVVGAMNGYVMVNILTIVQSFTPSIIRGRVFGFLTTLTGALSPLGMGLSGIVFDLLGHNLMLIYTACGIIMITGVLITAKGRDFREILQLDTGKDLPEPDNALSSAPEN